LVLQCSLLHPRIRRSVPPVESTGLDVVTLRVVAYLDSHRRNGLRCSFGNNGHETARTEYCKRGPSDVGRTFIGIWPLSNWRQCQTIGAAPIKASAPVNNQKQSILLLQLSAFAVWRYIPSDLLRSAVALPTRIAAVCRTIWFGVPLFTTAQIC
jgi:hypothetical protein